MAATLFSSFPDLLTVPNEKFPQHIFIIPDGNGRWAKHRGVPVTKGHEKGFAVAEEIIEGLSTVEQIKIVTMWGFSSDNWKRSPREVAGLMKIFSNVVKKAFKEFPKKNKRFVHLGRKDRLPKALQLLIAAAEEATKTNSGQIFCLALDFGGEDQTLRMLQAAAHWDGELTREAMYALRDGHGVIPPADLLIRTSGEKRTSDVGWLNGSPTELFFSEKYFPDLTLADVVDAIVDFSKRERRMGSRLT